MHLTSTVPVRDTVLACQRPKKLDNLWEYLHYSDIFYATYVTNPPFKCG